LAVETAQKQPQAWGNYWYKQSANTVRFRTVRRRKVSPRQLAIFKQRLLTNHGSNELVIAYKS